MLDIHAGATAPQNSPIPPIEFFTIQLMPLREGGISASLRSTTFDETGFWHEADVPRRAISAFGAKQK